MNIMEILNLQIDPMLQVLCGSRREPHKDCAMTEAAKEARRSCKNLRKDAEEVCMNLKGQLYGADIVE